MAMPSRHTVPVTRRQRVAIRVITLISLGLARLSPAWLRTLLARVSVAAVPAEYSHTEWAYRAVVMLSPRCAGWKGCLPRSIAVCLLCRLSGQWPTWCSGVRAAPPFTAHAWVQAEGRIVCEPGTPADYRPLIHIEAP